jgi:hypothetical protein
MYWNQSISDDSSIFFYFFKYQAILFKLIRSFRVNWLECKIIGLVTFVLC